MNELSVLYLQGGECAMTFFYEGEKLLLFKTTFKYKYFSEEIGKKCLQPK